MTETRLTPNQLAFLALSNEFCQAIESAGEQERDAFINSMLRLLPRLYISASDLAMPMLEDEGAYIPSALDEEYYDAVRRKMEALIGEDDTYLEVFESDMKYSDTPIAASISENLADIFQVLFNLTENVKDAPVEIVDQSLGAVKEDFEGYWSQPLCNVLRALNALRYA
ncbi:MAG: DUF5063 domain-containing protein [Bacteroidales bacterium]|nr:DUF5063 domain-containing protein [Bacteroidales bacterium]